MGRTQVCPVGNGRDRHRLLNDGIAGRPARGILERKQSIPAPKGFDQLMRRPVGVIIAAIILGLIALMGICVEGVALGVAIFYHSPVIPNLPFVRPVMVLASGMGLLFFLFCAWTVVGLFRMRGWARIATAVIGGVVCFFSLLNAGAMLWVSRFAHLLPPGPSSNVVSMVLVGLVAFYFLIALVGVWWLVYFNLASVRAAFAASRPLSRDSIAVLPPGAFGAVPEPRTPGWRIVLMVWAWLLLACVLFLPFALWMHVPLFLFGAIVQGGPATAAILVLAVLEIYLGVGLLRGWKAAWYLALLFQVYAVGYCASFLVPGMMTRYLAYQRALITQWGLPSPDLMAGGTATLPSFESFGMALGLGCGFVLAVVLTWALIRRREDYLGPRPAAD